MDHSNSKIRNPLVDVEAQEEGTSRSFNVRADGKYSLSNSYKVTSHSMNYGLSAHARNSLVGAIKQDSRLFDDSDLDRAQHSINLRSRSAKDNVGVLASVIGIGEEGEHEATQAGDDFVYNHHGLQSTETAALLDRYGRNELAEKQVPLWYIFVSQLWQPMPLMIWAAAIVEGAIQGYPDMAILLVIQFVNASIAFYEITKAGDAVAALRASLKPVATVKRDGEWKNVAAALIFPGDLVLLAHGSAVPADCRINPKEDPNSIAAVPTIDVDQAALTGESLPVTMYAGDSVKMGSTVVKGEVEATVEFTGGDTFFGKTASLLQVRQLVILLCHVFR